MQRHSTRALIMRTTKWISMALLPLTVAALATTADAQGKGKGKGEGGQKVEQVQGRGNGKSGKTATPSKGSSAEKRGNAGQVAAARGHGNAGAKVTGNAAHAVPASPNASPRAVIATSSNRGRAVSRYARDLHVNEVRPGIRTYVVSNKPSQFVTGGAVAYALARGAPENALVVVRVAKQVALRNRRGEELLVLDDDRARNLGSWQVSPLRDEVKSGSPSFCRSGAGHPVWGRQWCIDKGFGLGTDQNVRWGTTRDISNVILGRGISTGSVTRDALLNLLGPVVFNRLALHAVTLGYTDPLTGVWRSEATGPQVLLVNSGSHPVAELVDTNRDQRGDLMLVSLRPW
jgi:hypothetical protein